MNAQPTAAAAGTIDVGGDLTVNRLGFGAMRITGRGIWGDPPSRDQAIATLRRVVELGVSFIDTADSYGPSVSEELIAEALHPRDLIGYAASLGLDTGRFSSDLRKHAGMAQVNEDLESADLSNVSGTPTFFVNGKRHYGAYDIETLKKAVKLAKARALIST